MAFRHSLGVGRNKAAFATYQENDTFSKTLHIMLKCQFDLSIGKKTTGLYIWL